jgi:MYXO-CTERM domain-containing protein
VRALRAVLLALVVVLVVTGVPLLWLYTPAPAQPWGWVRDTHQAASTLVLNLGFVYVIAVVARRVDRWRWPHAIAFLAFVLAGSFTGFLLPWEQLGLWAVKVGTNMRGVVDAMSGEVRFVLMGGSEISKATYRTWVLVHTVGLPLVGLGGLWAVRRRVGSRPHAADAGEAPLQRDDALARHGDPQPHA